MEVRRTRIQADEKDPAGLYGTRSLGPTLAEPPWDYVTIQQASIKSHDVSTFRPSATQLQAYVKKHAPQAEFLLHQTWAYRCDDPRSPRRPRRSSPPAGRRCMRASAPPIPRSRRNSA